MTDTSGYLSPEEINAYQTRRASVARSYGNAASTLANRKAVGAENYRYGQGKLNDTWNRKYEGFQAAYGRRGVQNSGIAQRGMSNYLADRQTAGQDWTRQYQAQTGQLDEQQSGIDTQRDNMSSQIDSEQASRRAYNAATLRGMAS